MESWSVLLDILILLSAALVFGVLCEWLRQSPIIGYLAAGTLLGPNALELVSSGGEVETLAELGIALLLFTIGLEFSWRRLLGLGPAAIGGGLAQVLLTLVLAAGVSLVFGLGVRTSLAIGAVVALSSTACVLRLLISRAEIESIHGRHALGFLLVQDAAVVPLVLFVAILGGQGDLGDAGWALAKTLGGALLLVGVLYLLLAKVMPVLMRLDALRRNRDLPILVAIVVGLGSTWGSHELGLSPALGAFVAGMLLAASPFSTQIRADIASLRTLLVTLFFSSIGMLGDPAWFIENVGIVLGLVAAVLIGKALVIWPILRAFRLTHENALATGLCLAQIGEFSFILAASGRGTLIGDDLFRLIISATIISLFLTPYLVATAPLLSRTLVNAMRRLRVVTAPPPPDAAPSADGGGRILVIGFGPAGQAVGRMVAGHADDADVVVLDLNPAAIGAAREMDLVAHIGDAMHSDVLRHAGLLSCDTVVVTVPDPAVVSGIVRLIRSIAPDVFIIARARYHLYAEEIRSGGAHEVIDEEELTGGRMAAHLRRRLGSRIGDGGE